MPVSAIGGTPGNLLSSGGGGGSSPFGGGGGGSSISTSGMSHPMKRPFSSTMGVPPAEIQLNDRDRSASCACLYRATFWL